MTAHNYESQGKKVLIYTSQVDDRWGKNVVRSRVGVQREAIELRKDIFYDIQKHGDVSCVLVDEAQFLDRTDIKNLVDVVDLLDIPVICYGLKNDFQNVLFSGSEALLAYADDLELIKTICEHPDCGKKATMNLRFNNGKPTYNGEQVMTGDEEYKPVCRKHYRHYD